MRIPEHRGRPAVGGGADLGDHHAGGVGHAHGEGVGDPDAEPDAHEVHQRLRLVGLPGDPRRRPQLLERHVGLVQHIAADRAADRDEGVRDQLGQRQRRGQLGERVVRREDGDERFPPQRPELEPVGVVVRRERAQRQMELAALEGPGEVEGGTLGQVDAHVRVARRERAQHLGHEGGAGTGWDSCPAPRGP
jgi:hypothetical protein